jgi:hypothetical protein
MPCAWAIQSTDIEADRRRFKEAGVEVSDAIRAGRRRPDGVQLQWATADVGGGIRGSLFPFLIQDFTPRAQRAFPEGKPVTTDFRGITRVVIVVRDLDAAVAGYRRAFGLPEPLKQVDTAFGAQVAVLGSAPIVLAKPLPQGEWLRDRLDRFGEGPCAFVLGASRPNRYRAAAKSRWFGRDISWFDPAQLGWRLGFE